MNQESKSQFSYLQIAILWLVDWMDQGQFLINQGFSSRISLSYLTAFSILCFLIVIFQSYGYAFAESVLVLASRDQSIEAQKPIIGGSIVAFSITTLPFLLMLFLCSDVALKIFEIGEIPGVRTSFFIGVSASFFAGIYQIFNMMLVVSNRRALSMKLHMIAIGINIIGDVLAIRLFDNPKNQMIALSCAALVSYFALATFGAYYFRKRIQLSARNGLSYFNRAKFIVAGEIVGTLVFYTAPLLYSVILERKLGGESVAAFNVGFRILTIILSAAFAIQAIGVTYLSEVWNEKGSPEWRYRLRRISQSSLVAGGLVFLLSAVSLPFTLRWGYELVSPESLLIAGALLIAALPEIFVNNLVCQVKVYEKQRTRGFIIFSVNYLYGMPITYVLLSRHLVLGASVFGMTMPYFLYGAALIIFMRYLKRTGTVV